MGAAAVRRTPVAYVSIPFIVGLLVLVTVGHTIMQSAPSLGTAGSFAVSGGSTVTNTGTTVVDGNIGVSPGTEITGFPPGLVIPPGAIHSADAVAQQAKSDIAIAYDVLIDQACDAKLTDLDLGGLTLTPGVYCFDTSAQLTGKLTLDVQGDPNAVFIFQIGSTLTTAPGSSVVFVNGGPSCNVFWQIGSSATLDTNTVFAGNILALQSITLNTDADLNGRALARNGAVTMDDNNITRCVEAAEATNTSLPATQTAIALTPTSTVLAATQTAVAATETVVAATQTAIAPTLTAIALTPTSTVPVATQTAIAATQTVIAATQTSIAPTLTAIALTPRPTNTTMPLGLDETEQPTMQHQLYLPWSSNQ